MSAAPVMDTLLGRDLDLKGSGRWRLLKVLGGGLTAQVYLAAEVTSDFHAVTADELLSQLGTNPPSRHFAAFKVARPELDPGLIKRFTDERDLLIRLEAAEANRDPRTHYFPRVLHPREQGSSLGYTLGEGGRLVERLVLALELVRGQTLSRLLDASPGHRLTEETALAVADQYAEMLEVLHGQGLTCADRKFDDLYWDAATGLTVLDWNVVDQGVSGRALDLFRFGIFFFQMLFGVKPLFHSPEQGKERGGEEEWHLVGQLSNQPGWEDMSFGTQQILATALHPSPRNRYQSVPALRNDIRDQRERWRQTADLLARRASAGGVSVRDSVRFADASLAYIKHRVRGEQIPPDFDRQRTVLRDKVEGEVEALIKRILTRFANYWFEPPAGNADVRLEVDLEKAAGLASHEPPRSLRVARCALLVAAYRAAAAGVGPDYDKRLGGEKDRDPQLRKVLADAADNLSRPDRLEDIHGALKGMDLAPESGGRITPLQSFFDEVLLRVDVRGARNLAARGRYRDAAIRLGSAAEIWMRLPSSLRTPLTALGENPEHEYQKYRRDAETQETPDDLLNQGMQELLTERFAPARDALEAGLRVAPARRDLRQAMEQVGLRQKLREAEIQGVSDLRFARLRQLLEADVSALEAKREEVAQAPAGSKLLDLRHALESCLGFPAAALEATHQALLDLAGQPEQEGETLVSALDRNESTDINRYSSEPEPETPVNRSEPDATGEGGATQTAATSTSHAALWWIDAYFGAFKDFPSFQSDERFRGFRDGLLSRMEDYRRCVEEALAGLPKLDEYTARWHAAPLPGPALKEKAGALTAAAAHAARGRALTQSLCRLPGGLLPRPAHWPAELEPGAIQKVTSALHDWLTKWNDLKGIVLHALEARDMDLGREALALAERAGLEIFSDSARSIASLRGALSAHQEASRLLQDAMRLVDEAAGSALPDEGDERLREAETLIDRAHEEVGLTDNPLGQTDEDARAHDAMGRFARAIENDLESQRRRIHNLRRAAFDAARAAFWEEVAGPETAPDARKHLDAAARLFGDLDPDHSEESRKALAEMEERLKRAEEAAHAARESTARYWLERAEHLLTDEPVRPTAAEECLAQAHSILTGLPETAPARNSLNEKIERLQAQAEERIASERGRRILDALRMDDEAISDGVLPSSEEEAAVRRIDAILSVAPDQASALSKRNWEKWRDRRECERKAREILAGIKSKDYSDQKLLLEFPDVMALLKQADALYPGWTELEAWAAHMDGLVKTHRQDFEDKDNEIEQALMGGDLGAARQLLETMRGMTPQLTEWEPCLSQRQHEVEMLAEKQEMERARNTAERQLEEEIREWQKVLGEPTVVLKRIETSYRLVSELSDLPLDRASHADFVGRLARAVKEAHDRIFDASGLGQSRNRLVVLLAYLEQVEPGSVSNAPEPAPVGW